MGKKLSQEEYEKRVKDRVGDRYSVVGEYKGKEYPISIKCNVHNITFTVTASMFMRGNNDIRCSCPKCYEEKKHILYDSHSKIVECAYCGKKIKRHLSKLSNSKNNLYFCCREHKDLAQRLSSDEKFDIMRPNHYGAEESYRQKAFDTYEHKCAICGYDPEGETYLLDVHHIDSNRENNDISNLIILCPICHRKLTYNKYSLIDRNKLIKIHTKDLT